MGISAWKNAANTLRAYEASLPRDMDPVARKKLLQQKAGELGLKTGGTDLSPAGASTGASVGGVFGPVGAGIGFAAGGLLGGLASTDGKVPEAGPVVDSEGNPVAVDASGMPVPQAAPSPTALPPMPTLTAAREESPIYSQTYQAAPVKPYEVTKEEYVGDVQAPGQVDVERISAPTRAPVALRPAERAQVERAQAAEAVDTSGLGQQQRGLIAALQDQLAGRGGPSFAELQLKRGMERAANEQFALASAARGANRGAAFRQAARGAGNVMADANLQAAMLRAQETMQARGQLAGVLDSTRQQELELAMRNAGFAQQANLQNASETNTTSRFNADQGNDLALAEEEMKLEAALADNEAQLRAAIANQDQTQIARLQANKDRLTADLANRQTRQGVAGRNADAQNQQGADVMRETGTTSRFNAQQGQQSSQYNVGAQNDVTMRNADRQQRTGETVYRGEVGERDSIRGENQDIRRDTTTRRGQNLQANTAGDRLDLERSQGNDRRTDTYLGATATGLGAAGAQYLSSRNRTQPTTQAPAATSSGPTAADQKKAKVWYDPMSDREQKRDIRALASALRRDSDLADFLESMRPVAFRYRHPGEPGQAAGPQTGVIAQDLERSEIGRQVVDDGPGGKRIDLPRAVTATLAAMADMHKRLARLEGRR